MQYPLFKGNISIAHCMSRDREWCLRQASNHNFGLLLPTVAENGVMTKGVVSGRGVDLRLRRITSSPSQTLRRRLVRTMDDGCRGVLDACRRPSQLYFSHFATRTCSLVCRRVASCDDCIRGKPFVFQTSCLWCNRESAEEISHASPTFA